MAERDSKGRFTKGASGNPSGRPRKADELRQLLEGDAEEVARKVLEVARGGDMNACRLVLERLVPAVRPAHACVTFELDEEKPLADQGRQILAAVATGALPPDQGKALLDALAALARVTEIDEIDRRLKAIEEASNVH
ncbi:DUF5681 domain-containing protein [Halomonas urumqiensis]|uniref:DUF5681 domain-containing protein n=1 Tax=Halomonas urumqiensis TaxID=1684789 RepID=A0A2N7UFD5_9GAMM|nr:DUF5681 domain-containing protein [Halomonas urumqiensis]PMR79101.1 hypothetical protein C1H70_12395 [Halomonas urumqiensis]PTB03775.1 hypothetical protein C6V82_04680 [Halomonas urumqiensis]GHE19998.1 hypothetical protein GCM10017767_05190 [Halomonas urumqiensis]